MRKFKTNKNYQIISQLQGSNTHAYKKFGQNFLVDSTFSEYMVESLNLQPGDFIIEIGPGMGALTQIILANNNIGAKNYLGVEIDAEKHIYLSREYPGINLVLESVLDFDVEKFCNDHEIKSYKLIGSLPYNISKQIILKFSERELRPARAVLMVQKEVGQDYAGDPKTTFLTHYLNQYWNLMETNIVSAEAFFPVPEVDGMILVIDSATEKANKELLKFIRHGFSQPRKKLGNVLDLPSEDEFYSKRAHEISIEDWVTLYDHRSSVI